MLQANEISGILRFIDNWYFDGMPDIETKEFGEFILSSKDAIFKDIVERKNVPVKVDLLATTAYTDLERVYLPAALFIKEYYEKLFLVDTEDVETITRIAIAITNYMLIHEALHVQYTKANFVQLKEDALEHYSKREVEVIISIRQIIEDLYIEHVCAVQHVNQYRFVDMGQRTIFNEYFQQRNLEELKKAINYKTLTNLFVMYKSTWFNEHVYPELRHYAEDARNSLNDKERVEITMSIFQMFKRLIEEDEEENGEKSEAEKFGDEEGEEGEDGESESQLGSVSFGEADAETTKTIGELDEENLSEEDASKLKQVADNINKEIEKIENNERRIQRLEELKQRSSTKDVKISDAAEYTDVGDYDFVKMPKLRKIKNYLSFVSAPKKNHSILKEEGRRLVKRSLHRIATDGKIFDDKKQDIVRRDKPEVILLMDVSGSTDSRVTRRHNLRDYIVSSTREIYNTLFRAGFSVAAYAHTTKGWDRSLVLPIAANGLPYGDKGYKRMVHVDKMFAFAGVGIDNWGNADAIAVSYCRQKFSNKRNTKVLIVISDGLPTESRTGQHTEELRDEISIARSNGINVFSLSVAHDVIRNNDKIYGKQYNIAVSDPRKIDREMSKFLGCLMDI